TFTLVDDYPTALYEVTGKDVQNAANEYIVNGRATLLEYLPETSSAPKRRVRQAEEIVVGAAPKTLNRQTQPGIGDRLEFDQEKGEVLLFRRRTDLPLVAIHVLFPGGRRTETAENAGITNLMLKSMMKGTLSRTAE